MAAKAREATIDTTSIAGTLPQDLFFKGLEIVADIVLLYRK